MPMPSPAVREGAVAQTPTAISPLDSVLIDGKMTIPSPVLKFNGFGEFAGLLYHSPHSVIFEEDLYPTALHLFEARKFLYHRPDLADRIRQCEHVEEVTSLSEELGEFVRRDWGNVALNTVSNQFVFQISTRISLVLAKLMSIAVRWMMCYTSSSCSMVTCARCFSTPTRLISCMSS